MLADKMHFLVQRLDSGHVRSCVVSKLYLLSAADALCTPIEVAHVYRTSYLACNRMETGLPSFHRLSGAFRCEGKMHDLAAFHLFDDAEGYIASPLSVYRYTAKFSEKPSERTPEKLSLDHAVRFSAH